MVSFALRKSTRRPGPLLGRTIAESGASGEAIIRGRDFSRAGKFHKRMPAREAPAILYGDVALTASTFVRGRRGGCLGDELALFGDFGPPNFGSRGSRQLHERSAAEADPA